jgi:hypothetical protein
MLALLRSCSQESNKGLNTGFEGSLQSQQGSEAKHAGVGGARRLPVGGRAAAVRGVPLQRVSPRL